MRGTSDVINIGPGSPAFFAAAAFKCLDDDFGNCVLNSASNFNESTELTSYAKLQFSQQVETPEKKFQTISLKIIIFCAGRNSMELVMFTS